MSRRQLEARQHPRHKRPGVEIDAIRPVIDLAIFRDRVTMHHRVRQAVGAGQERLADPQEVVALLLGQWHARPNTRVDEEIRAADGRQG